MTEEEIGRRNNKVLPLDLLGVNVHKVVEGLRDDSFKPPIGNLLASYEHSD